MTVETPEQMEARLVAIAALPLDQRIAALDGLHDELKGFLDSPATP